MRHMPSITKIPAVAVEDVRDYGIFFKGANPHFQELGDLVGKWNDKIAPVINGVLD